MILQGSQTLLPPGGYPWEFFVGVCRPVLQILTRFQTKKRHFPHPFSDHLDLQNPYPFSDLAFRRKLCYYYLDWRANKQILQIHFELLKYSHILLSFLLIWNWNDKYVHILLQFPRKPHPIPVQNGQSVYPFSDQNGAKTLPEGAAHIDLYSLCNWVPPRPELLPAIVDLPVLGDSKNKSN